MKTNQVQVIILAAGQGMRMHSELPKVLHPIGGIPLLEHVLQTVRQISKQLPLVIVGHQNHVIKNALMHYELNWILQEKQLGTAHAVLQALPHIQDDARVLILYGDVPLISEATLKRLIDTTPIDALGVLTADLSNATGYGRIKRDTQNHVIGIIEEKDANEEERGIREVNSGIYLIPAAFLHTHLPLIQNQNAQQEYYLTDMIAIAHKEKIAIHTMKPDQHSEIFGVNDRLQLATLERIYQQKQAEKWMKKGVTLLDPNRFDIRGDAEIGKDVVIDINVILEGLVVIGDGCYIGANTILRNTVLANHVEIKANCVIDGAEIAAHCIIGPFARVRPGSVFGSEVHVGNFVEVKNSQVGENTKINHLSYVGDSEIGRHVNIGAGTITCNYDGANKHKTNIGDHVHIGSDTQLIAPVTVGDGATIAAGSTITKDVPAETLTLTHQLNQRSVNDWKRPKKEKNIE